MFQEFFFLYFFKKKLFMNLLKKMSRATSKNASCGVEIHKKKQHLIDFQKINDKKYACAKSF